MPGDKLSHILLVDGRVKPVWSGPGSAGKQAVPHSACRKASKTRVVRHGTDLRQKYTKQKAPGESRGPFLTVKEPMFWGIMQERSPLRVLFRAVTVRADFFRFAATM